MIRPAAVAGFFYPASPDELRRTLATCVTDIKEKTEVKAVVAPHAGYAYSGKTAGAAYSAVRLPRRFVILCPNHTGMGAPVAIMSSGAWETPLGRVQIDEELASLVRENEPLVQESPAAHRNEHSLEVQLPFLQYLLQDAFRLTPICLGTDNLTTLMGLGRAVAHSVKAVKEPVLIVASTDMNHFESARATVEKDQLAIDRIVALDSTGLYQVVHGRHITMCGYGPTIAVMEAARELGATEARLIGHTHSGEVTGDHSRVVGYASFVLR